VGFGEALVTLSVADLADASVEDVDAQADTAALAFVAPMSGRFYGRPSPEEPPFVVAGATVTRGQTVGLLEVMKTFNRLVYQGDGLPESARVVAVVPEDGADVTRGDPILRLDSDDEG
jgi:acetyl-CoA carboxylase biotin carboxyl carrier protein